MLEFCPGYQSGGQKRRWSKSLGGQASLCKASVSFSRKLGWGGLLSSSKGTGTLLQAQQVQENLGLSLQRGPLKNQGPLLPS